MSANHAWVYSGSLAGRVVVYAYETSDPTVTDDAASDFIVTSRWINTSSKEEFVCLDATPGAAIWKGTTSGGGGGGGPVTYGGPVALVVGGANVSGGSTDVTRADHVHALPPYAIAGSATPGDTAAAGVADSFARSDHRHALPPYATAGSATPGDTAAEGAASSFARSDHRHALPAFGSTAGSFCEGNDGRLSDDRAPLAHNTTHQSGGSDAIKLDDFATPDDNTDLDASPTAHGLLRKLDNDTTHFLRGDGAWAPGSGSPQIFFPDAPPETPHACDDEFTAGTIDAKWAEWDVGGLATFSIDTDRRMLKCVGTSDGTVRLAGLYQPVPASEFAFIAKIGSLFQNNGNAVFDVGVFVSQDIATNPSTADARTFGIIQYPSIWGMRGLPWTSYNVVFPDVDLGFLTDLRSYVRIRCNGTSLEWDTSPDGITWRYQYGEALAWSPSHFGFSFSSAGVGSVSAVGYYDFMRVKSGGSSSLYNSHTIGRFV